MAELLIAEMDASYAHLSAQLETADAKARTLAPDTPNNIDEGLQATTHDAAHTSLLLAGAASAEGRTPLPNQNLRNRLAQPGHPPPTMRW